MKSAALLLAPGFEEGEALTIVDILRRAEFVCDIVGLSQFVCGGHSITVKCDRLITDDLPDYDMVILPGGYEGVDALQNSDAVLRLISEMNNKGKYICAICAAPIVLEKAGLLAGKNYTAYLGYDKIIKDGFYCTDKVVIDGNIVTGRGPAMAYAFAYKLVDVLGGDSLKVKNRMVYFNAFDVKEWE